jgi:hypothetical protein
MRRTPTVPASQSRDSSLFFLPRSYKIIGRFENEQAKLAHSKKRANVQVDRFAFKAGIRP